VLGLPGYKSITDKLAQQDDATNSHKFTDTKLLFTYR